MVKSIAELRKDLSTFGERVARLEGFMEGIRDAIAGKAVGNELRIRNPFVAAQ